MKLTVFFLLLIFTLNLEEKHPFNPEEKPNPEKPEEKIKHKDLHFIRTDERFSEPFIGHLKVLDTSTFNLEINEYKEKEEEKELNKIVANSIKLYQILKN